jgi:hypothetical protein
MEKLSEDVLEEGAIVYKQSQYSNFSINEKFFQTNEESGDSVFLKFIVFVNSNHPANIDIELYNI